MSRALMAWVWSREVDAVDTLLLLRLADLADDDGRNIRSSIRELAYDCNLSVKSVTRRLKHWRIQGALIVLNRGGGGAGDKAVYALDVSAIEAKPPRSSAARARAAHTASVKRATLSAPDPNCLEKRRAARAARNQPEEETHGRQSTARLDTARGDALGR